MNNMGYGAITNTDAEVLEAALGALLPLEQIDVLEIGTHRGGTARGIKAWCESHKRKLSYTGIENGAICLAEKPFVEAQMIFGDSIMVSHLAPPDVDLVFVDGNHDGNHVILETLLYGAKVRQGGFMLFHDTAPHIQQTMPEAEGPAGVPWFCNSVNAAHALMGFPTKEWKLHKSAYDPSRNLGGMTAYQKLYRT